MLLSYGAEYDKVTLATKSKKWLAMKGWLCPQIGSFKSVQLKFAYKEHWSKMGPLGIMILPRIVLPSIGHLNSKQIPHNVLSK